MGVLEFFCNTSDVRQKTRANFNRLVTMRDQNRLRCNSRLVEDRNDVVLVKGLLRGHDTPRLRKRKGLVRF